MDNNEWISIKDRMPPDKTWVEAIRRIPGTNITYKMDWFYLAECWDRFDKSRVTHWRFITHSIFDPIANYSISLELPTNER